MPQNVNSLFGPPLKVLKEVFRNYRYAAFAALLGFAVFSLSMWLRNLELLAYILTSPAVSFSGKILFLARLLGGIKTSVSLFSAFLIIAMSLLFGINGAFFAYYIFKHRTVPGSKANAGAGFGILSGVLGIGCASCGSFLLSAILASIGASGAIALLPLRGLEFSIISVLLLSMSVYWLARAINSRMVCAPEYGREGRR